ncbi:MAG: ABC transporter ATP-binding protein [Pseudomonadota bacterium]|nr:ABC transporter ATP-binding protein [Pseudomonadota bacterium]
MASLSLRSLSHSFGDVRAVDGFSLEIAEGEIVCLLGPSGCGKTTTLRLAAGLEPLQQGEIAMGAQVVAGPGVAVPPEGRGIGMVFQDYALFPHLDVAGNVGFGLRGLPGPEREVRVRDMLARVGLTARAGVYPHQLSGGEQQRVALARALAPQPSLMLMDEPFANLDVTLRNAVRDETLALLKDHGATVLLVTHDPEEAMRMADRIVVMRGGRLVQAGPPDEIYLRPVDDFMARFFGPVNEIAGTVAGGTARTAFGTAPADLADGPARVLVRPEGLVLGDTGHDMIVSGRRLIGAYWRVILRDDAGTELRARVVDRPPQPGTRVKVSLDAERAIVFPCDANRR